MNDTADIWTKTEQQGDKTLYTLQTRDHATAQAMRVAPQLLQALIWCEAAYGKEWAETASIRETIKLATQE